MRMVRTSSGYQISQTAWSFGRPAIDLISCLYRWAYFYAQVDLFNEEISRYHSKRFGGLNRVEHDFVGPPFVSKACPGGENHAF
jgi:hypothetical protein